jgi:gamma-glutamylcyclotransferase (GGCT)/AIG2-like uncharacterized protein YtfP
MFVNGQAMSDGPLHRFLKAAGPGESVRTADGYRFFSFGEFPGIQAATAGGARIQGEVYPISYADLREHLLPQEPPELELSVIELEDGRGSLSMVVRDGALETAQPVEITPFGGWRAYLASGGQGA